MLRKRIKEFSFVTDEKTSGFAEPCPYSSVTAHDVCDSPEEAPHYHTYLGPKLRA
jgi:hypothetical protein